MSHPKSRQKTNSVICYIQQLIPLAIVFIMATFLASFGIAEEANSSSKLVSITILGSLGTDIPNESSGKHFLKSDLTIIECIYFLKAIGCDIDPNRVYIYLDRKIDGESQRFKILLCKEMKAGNADKTIVLKQGDVLSVAQLEY